MGYRNMKVYLERKGIVLSRITVHKYMNKALGLVSIVRRKKPTYESGEAHKKSVDVYSSPYRVGRRYTRFYGDFYTTDGEYITSLHWSKRGISLMKNVLLRALMYNIVGLFIMVGFYFLKYDINKTHTKEMLLIIFLGEVFYWLTVIIGLLIIKRLKS